MKPKKWPPPETQTSVLALIDECWIEVNKQPSGYWKASWNNTPKEWVEPSWNDFSPVTLSSHGCGCCANDDSLPTYWTTLPEMPE